MGLWRGLDRLLGWTAFILVRLYQLILSPLKTLLFGPGAGCRFQPTCSQYACDCFRRHAFLRALYLTVRRIGRCHPFGTSGYDPVPPGTTRKPTG